MLCQLQSPVIAKSSWSCDGLNLCLWWEKYEEYAEIWLEIILEIYTYKSEKGWIILSCVPVTKTRVRIGNCIY
jgi:hypothetical protein